MKSTRKIVCIILVIASLIGVFSLGAWFVFDKYATGNEVEEDIP